MSHFDPNAAAGEESGIFGLPFSEKESSLVLIPVPWEATTSYGGGTSKGPSAILQASRQIDLFDTDVLRPYEPGLHMIAESTDVKEWNTLAKSKAQLVIEVGGNVENSGDLKADLETVNLMSHRVDEYVYQETKRILNASQWAGIVGGDHSVPFGALRAISEKCGSFGILHFDAHSDTRRAFEGFVGSHASIMYNVLENIPQVKKLVQVGIRDISEEEVNYVSGQKERVSVFYDRDLARKKFEGSNWATICQEIVAALPKSVWISFDIDGLDPRFCPNTGTPVPGGLDFQEANYLLYTLVKAGKKIIGFDLNEVAPDPSNPDNEWDANVGARILYKLCAWTLASQGKVALRN